MYKFNPNLYTDVRIENNISTRIRIENNTIVENKEYSESGVIVRVFDGELWYTSSITNFDSIQKEIDYLSKLAKENPNINENKIVNKYEVNRDKLIQFESILGIENREKENLISDYNKFLNSEENIIPKHLLYIDNYIRKHIITSKGTDVEYDYAECSVNISYYVKSKDNNPQCFKKVFKHDFNELKNKYDELEKDIEKNIEFYNEAKPISPNEYTCILSPMAAGIFAHESFGHKSEADFMVGDEKMLDEWAIGKKVGSDILNIVDCGNEINSGFVPYDDEGNKSKKTYLIKNGILMGRLHSSETSALLDEEVTGNARAVNFEFDSIVRMTSTFIEGGNMTVEELFSSVKNGIYIDTVNHGSGMSTFTLAPQRAYLIKDGKISSPVLISVITGNVMRTLNEITGVSNEVEIISGTACGKNDQFPLRVAVGGPYIKVNKLQVS
ncbi:TldD/PmbA family protein [Miniphocaeibacter halophilus]|uniref:TldD/PmbA family protein n=1 Tax=Miniphocaeibacter halophilus TaxID=2931922 RepID=A0AC61MVY2_9FIRM|nr:TldD/PmbA family protein [Miniphocaeibacter halophilus]QQK07953.1 TldD/PmbA family protein [Miniphocaeibacter halophilus]